VLALLAVAGCQPDAPEGDSEDSSVPAVWRVAEEPRVSIGVVDGDERYPAETAPCVELVDAQGQPRSACPAGILVREGCVHAVDRPARYDLLHEAAFLSG
jgi:hypothetical protein